MSVAADDQAAEALVRADAARIAAQLRERGDPVSLEAAAQIEGGVEAYAGLVDAHRHAQARLADAERNLAETLRLWHRVPAAVRVKAAGPIGA